MKSPHHLSALALVAGTLAEAIRPGPREVYIADNSRLWPDADSRKYRAEVLKLCKPHGLECVWPSEHYLFPDLLPPSERDDAKVGRLLPRAPLMNISGVSAIVADVSPFRGPSLNPVIAFEIGIAVTLGVPVFAWTEATQRNCAQRQTAFRPIIDRIPNDVTEEGPGGLWYDSQGFKVEDFGLVESAVIAGSLTSLSRSPEEAFAACFDHFAGRHHKADRQS